MDDIIESIKNMNISNLDDKKLEELSQCMTKLTLNTNISIEQKKVIVDKFNDIYSILYSKARCVYPITMANTYSIY
jgi:hypothetical protein